jgi:hypothetical protein
VHRHCGSVASLGRCEAPLPHQGVGRRIAAAERANGVVKLTPYEFLDRLAWLVSRQQGHPWPLPPRAVGAKAKVWLDRHASLRLADAGASAAAGRVCAEPAATTPISISTSAM